VTCFDRLLRGVEATILMKGWNARIFMRDLCKNKTDESLSPQKNTNAKAITT